MSDPLSFVAAVIAVATLAGNVATKGCRYLKAVKDCPDDVRALMAEVNVLCGILDRLAVLLKGKNSKPNATSATAPRAENHLQDPIDDDREIDTSSESEDEAKALSTPLETPNFIYECQRTLEEIQSILYGFGRSSQSLGKPGRTSRLCLSALRRLEPKDLTWPLSKSKTLQLIQTLERHKTTSTIALAESGMVSIHKVLMQSKVSNRHIAEILAKQGKTLELQLSQEEEKILNWLSPVNPAVKHREFKEERHPRTGTWLFDLPEMMHWLENPNDALWIYGIPGAGKTTLSTLVVDEILTRKRSNTVGTAYFYVRHNDKDSQKPANVLGSIVAQLARQNSRALTHLMNVHKRSYTQGLTAPSGDELSETLHHMIEIFAETYIMIDGLDESGSCFNPNRRHLINAVAGLSSNEEGSIRTLIFSRDEQDIRKQLTQKQFHAVSIAATSADLRLFANAWLGRLEVQSEKLRCDIVDTLVDEAKGMFMWVRAQIDYLQRLPNDMEKRRALTKLPPDLPQTYIRIFENMNSTYPSQTIQYIRRLLKWLVFGSSSQLEEGPYNSNQYCNFCMNGVLPLDALCQAICIENESDWPTIDIIPTTEQVLRWLGCLVRFDQEENTIQLSHFTIKEFLAMDPQTISSPIARQYLVGLEDKEYLVNVCLTYLLHSHFEGTVYTTANEVELFLSEYPFYRYIALTLCAHLYGYTGWNAQVNRLAKEFLSMPPSSAFKLWEASHVWHDHGEYEGIVKIPEVPVRYLPSPLHFASVTCLVSWMEELLREGVDPDATETLRGCYITPLHLAISIGTVVQMSIRPPAVLVVGLEFYDFLETDRLVCKREQHSLQMTEMLVNSGADVDRQLLFGPDDLDSGKIFSADEKCSGVIATPLVLALTCGAWKIASLLLKAGAAWDATAKIGGEYNIDLCSVKRLLEAVPKYEIIVQRAFEESGLSKLTDILKEWRFLRDRGNYHNLSTSSSANSSMDLQDAFVDAFSNQQWEEVRELLSKNSYLDVNQVNKDGWNAIHYASVCNEDALEPLLQYGASLNLVSCHQTTAICMASGLGYLYNVELLLDYGVDPNHRDFYGWTPLLASVYGGQIDTLQFLLGAGADISARLDGGRGALHIAIRNKNIDMVSTLLERKIDCLRPDNYGTTPLHLACLYELEDQIGQLIKTMDRPAQEVNAVSLEYGTPLYTAACAGSASIINILLDSGAEIDQIGSGNLLGSALMAACANGHSATVKTLLSRGAALEVEGSRFESAEGTARAFRREEILGILEEHGIMCGRKKKDELIDESQTKHAGNMKDPNDPHPSTPKEGRDETLGTGLEQE